MHTSERQPQLEHEGTVHFSKYKSYEISFAVKLLMRRPFCRIDIYIYTYIYIYIYTVYIYIQYRYIYVYIYNTYTYYILPVYTAYGVPIFTFARRSVGVTFLIKKFFRNKNYLYVCTWTNAELKEKKNREAGKERTKERVYDESDGFLSIENVCAWRKIIKCTRTSKRTDIWQSH